jgi:type I restriction enzyme M protein
VQKWFQPSAVERNSHNRWAREFVYGIEDNEDLAMATQVNMILHGVASANVEKADGLAAFADYHGVRSKVESKPTNHPYTQGVNEQFDFVISNPPFSLKEDERTLSRYGATFAYADRKNSENLFVERWYQLLREGGRLGVVLPDSVFDTNENLYVRMFLYRFFNIRAVVSLPVVAFQPHTPTKTSLLFAEKKSRDAVEAWDRAWRVAAKAYGEIRKSEVVRFVLRNERLRNALIDLANKAQVDWYPATNLLSSNSMPAQVRAELVRACESDGLKKRCTSLLLELDVLLEENALATLQRSSTEESRASILSLLRDRIPKSGDMRELSQLVDAAYDEIVDAAELNYTADPKGQNYCNAWWCFAEIAGQEQFRGEIFFGEAEHVGFKRTSRHPQGIAQDNHLFEESAAGEVKVDTAHPKTVLDALRAARVFSH